MKLVKSEKSQLSIAANSSGFILILSLLFSVFRAAVFFSAFAVSQFASKMAVNVIALFHVWVSLSFLPFAVLQAYTLLVLLVTSHTQKARRKKMKQYLI